MVQNLLSLAEHFYRAIPSRAARDLVFRWFCSLVKKKHLVAVRDNITYDLDLGEMIDLAIYLGTFEPEVRAALKEICKPGMVVLDIGANIGAHALPLAALVGSKGRVYAFEPISYAFQKLNHNTALNKFPNLYLFQLALGETTTPHQEIAFRASWPTNGTRKDLRCFADYVTLDEWIEKNRPGKVDLIKLDVDGNEFSVLKGGENLLTRDSPYIIIEVWGPNFVEESRNPFTLLEKRGYEFRRLNDGYTFHDGAEMKKSFLRFDECSYSFGALALPTKI